MRTVKKTITIEREIKVDDYLREFIFFNINYRRKIWNLFVEEYTKCDGVGFDINAVRGHIMKTVDVNIKNNEYYCVDVVNSVYKDVKDAYSRVIKDAKKDHKYHRLRFKRFDRYYGAFRVHSRMNIHKVSRNIIGKIHIKDPNKFEFRASMRNHFNIHLIEPLYGNKDFINYYYTDTKTNSYSFKDTDIKQIYFKHELGDFILV